MKGNRNQRETKQKGKIAHFYQDLQYLSLDKRLQMRKTQRGEKEKENIRHAQTKNMPDLRGKASLSTTYIFTSLQVQTDLEIAGLEPHTQESLHLRISPSV